GSANDGRSAPIVVSINEWMASNTRTLADPATAAGKFDDWFELYNPGASTVDLTGYFLTDNLTNKFQYLIPRGYLIPPHGFLLVWADNEPNQNSSNRTDLHVSFQLNKDGEAIGLVAADGTQIDAVTFGPQTNDVSQGRYPDGSFNIVTLPMPTPRASNGSPGGNAPPVLAPIGNQTVHRGQTLTFTAGATDPDAPPQVLTFSLDAGAPAGATINPSSGAFSWPTVAVPVLSTNTVTVRVTDNGSPALSDSETIRLIVVAPPGFNLISRSGNQLTLGWATIPGRMYRVEYVDDLGSGNWLPLSGNTLA